MRVLLAPRACLVLVGNVGVRSRYRVMRRGCGIVVLRLGRLSLRALSSTAKLEQVQQAGVSIAVGGHGLAGAIIDRRRRGRWHER